MVVAVAAVASRPKPSFLRPPKVLQTGGVGEVLEGGEVLEASG